MEGEDAELASRFEVTGDIVAGGVAWAKGVFSWGGSPVSAIGESSAGITTGERFVPSWIRLIIRFSWRSS